MDKPTALPNPDFAELLEQCQKYIDFMASDEYYSDNDYAHYIYEATIEAVYGPDVWKWINTQVNRDDE